MTSWLLLHYKLPSKPSALRVYIWRKLKRLGAILLHEAIWVLPDQPRTAEQIQWLAAEIEEMGGNACYWRASSLLRAQEEAITHQFQAQVDAVYSDLLKQLEKPRPDLQEISRAYQQALSQDFFQSKLGALVREKLTSKRGERS
ncbi:MAG TPA: Chromate resistance protein ChrB [Anaerolineales bacterium]|nr:Chromate resistance protein ChrB [Anaerolineales bacterium]